MSDTRRGGQGRGLLESREPADAADLERRRRTAAFLDSVLDGPAPRFSSAKRLADAADLDPGYIGLLRRQQRTLAIDASNKLATALGLPAWYVARECGLLPDAPPDEDVPGVAASPLKKSLIREITEENDEATLARMIRLWEAARDWPSRAENGDALPPAKEKKRSGDRLAIANPINLS